MENNFLHIDLECVRKRNEHTKHTHIYISAIVGLDLYPFLHRRIPISNHETAPTSEVA
jgi:hypothetical protein